MAAGSSTTTKVTLPSDKEILITREFDAPRDVVFKAMTDPAPIPQWWGPMARHLSVETATFAERDGRTLLTTRTLFASKEDRDGMVQSGMEKGLTETHDRFAELLVELRAGARGATR